MPMITLLKIEPYPKENRERRRDVVRNDVFVCDICNNVWQYRYHRHGCEYLEDFPRYGLKEKTCKYCKKLLTNQRNLNLAPSPA